MKTKILTLGVVLVSAACVMAQGTVNYSTRVVNNVVAHIYGPEVGDNTVSRTGNAPNGFPEGTQVYTGSLLTGSGFTAQLWYAAGADQAEEALGGLASSITSFRTGNTFGGSIVPSIQTLPGAAIGSIATLQLRVWDNLGGTVNTWAEAEALWLDGDLALGKSLVFNSGALADPGAPTAPDMTGLRSFNVFYAIPEPSTFVLAGLAAASLLIFRRRK